MAEKSRVNELMDSDAVDPPVVVAVLPAVVGDEAVVGAVALVGAVVAAGAVVVAGVDVLELLPQAVTASPPAMSNATTALLLVKRNEIPPQ